MNFKLLKELSETAGIASQEDRIRKIVRRELKGSVDSMKTDTMGSVIGFRKGSSKTKKRVKVMMAAHMDEIGFIVKHIDSKGFLRLQALGGFDPRQLFSQRVVVNASNGKPLHGVLSYSTKPAHLLTPEETRVPPKIDNFFVDLGMKPAAVKKAVEIGDMVTMDRSLEKCGDMVIGKALDNRVGVYVMIEAMKLVKQAQVDIYPVATTQEEIGLRGAGVAAMGIEPDIAVALDTTIAADIPGSSEVDAVTNLGEGTAIKIMDGSLVCHPKLVKHFKDVAKAKKISHQMEILPRGGTDGGAIQRAGTGSVCMTLSIPTRYIHTVNEMVHVKDVDATVKLLAAYLQDAHKGRYAFD